MGTLAGFCSWSIVPKSPWFVSFQTTGNSNCDNFIGLVRSDPFETRPCLVETPLGLIVPKTLIKIKTELNIEKNKALEKNK